MSREYVTSSFGGSFQVAVKVINKGFGSRAYYLPPLEAGAPWVAWLGCGF